MTTVTAANDAERAGCGRCWGARTRWRRASAAGPPTGNDPRGVLAAAISYMAVASISREWLRSARSSAIISRSSAVCSLVKSEAKRS